MRKRLMVALLLGLTATAPIATQGLAQGSDRINSIIEELAPADAAARGRKGYRDRIERVEIQVRDDAGPRAPDGSPIQNTYILNYNHSVDVEIFFAFDSARITPQAAAELDVLGRALTSPRLGDAVYLLAGHTDAKGRAEYNQRLSERRALAARQYLIEHFPIDPDRLVAVGFGEARLADPEHPTSAVNRRVEVTLIETGDDPAVSRIEVDPEPVVAGNVVCDTAPVALEDPRPAEHGLDDFGGRRTPVACAEEHDQRDPEAVVEDVVVEDVVVDGDSLNDAIGQ